MAIKIYISQANQAHNAGPNGYREKAGMVAISKLLMKEFRNDKRFLAKRNYAGTRVDTAYENTQDANRWGADWYLALHSNAGNGQTNGTIGFCSAYNTKGNALARSVSWRVGKLSPGGYKGIVLKPGFIELKYPNAPAALIELEYHDNVKGVTFLTTKKAQIARAIYEGVCAACKLESKPQLTGKILKVPVPVRRPAWWDKFRAYLRSTQV